MALNGKIIDLGRGQLAFEYHTTLYNEPMQTRDVWPLTSWKTSGYSYCTETDAIGKPATITDGQVSCYLRNGNYLKGTIDGSAKSIIHELLPVPRPTRVRSELRWHYGQWQKLTRKGWIAA